MKPKKELKDELNTITDRILQGAPLVKTYAEYTYLIGKMDTLVDVLKVRKRKKNTIDDGKNVPLKDFGMKDPVRPKPKDGEGLKAIFG